MKTLGRRVKEFRTAPERKWSTGRMADEVKTSRQNIENLEAGEVSHPRYIAGLARVMGTSVDDLLGSDSPASHASDDEPSAPEWAHLAEYREMSNDDRREIDRETTIRAERMRALRREVMQGLGLPTEAKPGAGNSLPMAPRSTVTTLPTQTRASRPLSGGVQHLKGTAAKKAAAKKHNTKER